MTASVRLSRPVTEQVRVPTVGPAAGRARVRSVDVTRGGVVGASLVMSHVLSGRFATFGHAPWYGLTLLDLVFPAFLTLFGVGLGLACAERVRWPRVLRRTLVLVALGVAFNVVTSWNADPDVVRVTGVLQRFAVVGLAVVVITRAVRRPVAVVTLAGALLVGHGLLLVWTGPCAGQVPTPECNVSGQVDPAVFGASHVYAQATAGYDPEGIPTTLGATASGLIGYAAGVIVRTRSRSVAWQVAVLGLACAAATPLLTQVLPVGKRLWTPGFATATCGVTLGALALVHLAVEADWRWAPLRRAVRVATWPLEALGRNSLLVYFGKYIVLAVLAHLAVVGGDGQSLLDRLKQAFAVTGDYGDLWLSAFMTSAWLALAMVLHWRGAYLRV